MLFDLLALTDFYMQTLLCVCLYVWSCRPWWQRTPLRWLRICIQGTDGGGATAWQQGWASPATRWWHRERFHWNMGADWRWISEPLRALRRQCTLVFTGWLWSWSVPRGDTAPEDLIPLHPLSAELWNNVFPPGLIEIQPSLHTI